MDSQKSLAKGGGKCPLMKMSINDYAVEPFLIYQILRD